MKVNIIFTFFIAMAFSSFSIAQYQNKNLENDKQEIIFNKLTPYEYTPEISDYNIQQKSKVENPDPIQQFHHFMNQNKPLKPERSYMHQPGKNLGGKAYCSASGSTSYEFIEKVTFGTINNITGNNAYEDWTSIVTDLNRGSSYNFSVMIGSWWIDDVSAVWIDWNHDEIFDDNTNTERYDCSAGTAVQSLSITVPLDAILGQTRMRVRMRDGSFGDPLEPCNTTPYGEVEDYTINVLEVSNDPVLSISPSDPYDLGNVGLNEVVTQVFTFSNTGAGSINISDIELDASSDPEFSILSVYGVPGTLPPDNITVKIQFAPVAEGFYSATINVAEDITDGISTVEISGNGVIRPANNDCDNAQLLPETYPQSVTGSTLYSTGDPNCITDPTIWYKVVLPHYCNTLVVNYCPTPANLGTNIETIMAHYFENCNCSSSHPHSVLDFYTCSSGVAPYIEFTNIPGPDTILLPVSISDAIGNFELDFEFNLNVINCTPSSPACGNYYKGILEPALAWQQDNYSSGDTYYWEFSASDGYNYAFSNCGSDEDTKIRIYNQYFDEIASNDDFGPYCSGSEASLDWLCEEDGIYYVSLANAEDYPVSCQNLSKSYHLAYKYSTCGAPTNLYIDNLTISSAHINWTNNSVASDFIIEWGLPEFVPGTGTAIGTASIQITSSPYYYNITGLNEGTSYDCYVQTNCGSGDLSTWAGPVMFSTLNINDDCENATNIGEVFQMPYSTMNATFDGPGGCVTSPNIWYNFTAPADGDLTITTNGSSYDTRITVYEGIDCLTMTELDCDDDGGSGIQSFVKVLNVSAGEQFKIEVGGSYSSIGNGVLTVELFDCPAGSISENEPCGDNVNGGCFMPTPNFEQVGPGDVVCGTLWAESGQRDMDWFELTLTEYATVTMNVYGTGPIVFGPAEMSQPGCSGCDFITGFIEPAGYIQALANGSITSDPLPPGTYIFIVQPNLFSGYPCEELRYIAEWTTETYVPYPGEFCANVISAEFGLNSADTQHIWFSFEGSDKDVRITSCIPGQTINTDLFVREGCCGAEVVSNDDDPGCTYNTTASSVEFFAEAGITYYLLWEDTYTSDAFTFNIIDLSVPQYTWTGTNSTDWADSGNWLEGSVPDPGVSALIPSVPAGGNLPETNTNIDAACYDLTIEDNAHVYVASGNTLTVGGVLYNFEGADGLHIQASPTGFGSLIHHTPGVEAVVEQFLYSERWHLVSPPVTDATANTYFDIYLKEYHETDNTWSYITDPAYPLNVAQGYTAWADDSYTGPTSVSYSGELLVEDYPISILSYTPSSEKTGFNLVGNPFISSVAWNDNWPAIDVAGAAYFYDGVQYVNWNRITEMGTAVNGHIPPTQGFFILATSDNASITIPKSERLHGTQAFYKAGNTFDNMIDLKIQGNGYADEIIIAFTDLATEFFDYDFDAMDIRGIQEAPQLYSVSGELEYSVNVLSFPFDKLVMPLGLEAGISSTYTVTVDQLQAIDFKKIILEDIMESTFTEISDNTTIQISAGPEDDNHRFNLHFIPDQFGTPETVQGNAEIYSFEGVIYIRIQPAENAFVQVFNIIGQEIISQQISDELNRIVLNEKAGNYLVKVRSDKGIAIEKVFVE